MAAPYHLNSHTNLANGGVFGLKVRFARVGHEQPAKAPILTLGAFGLKVLLPSQENRSHFL